jgi:hypothetical protein
MLRNMKVKFYLKSAFVRPEDIVVFPGLARGTYLRCSLKGSAGDHKTLTILPLGDVEVAGLTLGFEGDGLGLKGLPEVKMYFIADDYVLLSFMVDRPPFRCDGIEGVVECLESVLSAPPGDGGRGPEPLPPRPLQGIDPLLRRIRRLL